MINSVSSRNHFTVKGGVPLKVVLKRTVVFGMTAWCSGTTTKLGGSDCSEVEEGGRKTDKPVKELATSGDHERVNMR